MSLLVAGLVLFMAIHLIPSAPRLRAALVERLGAKPYRGVFSAVALLSVVAVVWGFSRSPIEAVYAPPAWGHQASMILVPIRAGAVRCGQHAHPHTRPGPASDAARAAAVGLRPSSRQW